MEKQEHTHRDNSLAEIIAMLDSPLDMEGKEIPKHERSTAKTDKHKCDWAGGSLADARQLIETGWPERPDISAIATDILTHGQTCEREETELSVCGAFPDVGEFLSGSPENMVAFVQKPAPRIVTVIVAISAHCGIPQESFEARGAVALATVEALTIAGYGVELKVATASKQARTTGKPSHSNVVTIKPASQHLDTDTLVYWTCHKTALRQTTFRIWENEPADIRRKMGFKDSEGYGQPIKFDPVLAETPCDILIDPNLDRECRNAGEAVRFFETIMEQFETGKVMAI